MKLGGGKNEASTCFLSSSQETEEVLPAVELHFNYISRDRRRRRYVLLDDDPQQALQVNSPTPTG